MAIIDILGVQFNTIDLSQAAEDCMSIVERGERGYPVPVNVNIIMQMRTEKAVRTGVALMEALIERAALEGRPVYFLGATAAVIQVLIERLNKDLPSLKIAGYSDGYFSEEEEPERVTAIAESGANLLFVGMGVPRQEQFIIRNWENLGVNLVLAGGGSFDVISGIKQRTPQAWSRFGFEWLYRLIQDPKRYYRRYLETFPKFLLIATVASLYRIPQRLFLRTPVPSKSQRDLNREQ
jgi:N-acetylglucosaminyldiphosphoundecaprenol N-acetyl-beta-D-mannosaminyltransferase